MKSQSVFERVEIKYLITEEQKEDILAAMAPFMEIDNYGRSTIRNIYFDTDDFILARHSIAKPDFKEKFRVRSYTRADANSTVFIELKRKFDGIVYKRRVALAKREAVAWTKGESTPGIHRAEPQMANEIDYFMNLYEGLHPALCLSYEREAYRMKDGSDFRVTFDDNILARDYDLSLDSEIYGTALLEKGMVLMELKCSGGIPMWMTKILSDERIYKTSFSKYGKAYESMLFPTFAAEFAANYRAAIAINEATGHARTQQHAGAKLQHASA